MSEESFRIAVFPGDGIGNEITEPCVELMQRAVAVSGGRSLTFEWLEAGADTYKKTGTALPEASVAAARAADAILLAAMGDPAIRYPDGTEIVPQIDMRFILDLYAGVRPVRTIPGVRTPLADPRTADIDFVLVRESTEGLFAPEGRGEVTAERGTDSMIVTRKGVDRVSRFSFELARSRKRQGHRGKLELIDKANVFPSLAFMREVFDAAASDYPDIETGHAYVDARAMQMIQRPWEFDVMVTENMFGDILSDLGAGLMGGLGFAPSADIGDDHAVFQPCHGTAPDIAGKGLANPTAMFLSGAMLLEWLGERRGEAGTRAAGRLIREAVDDAFRGGDLVTCDIGGDAGTATVAKAVSDALEARLG